MSGQLEVHHTALCTAPVSLNLRCRGPYPQLGHSPRVALTLRPYCFDSCTHLEVMQNVIVMYTQWPCTLVSIKNKYTCVQNQGGLEGRYDTREEEWGGEKNRGYRGRQWIWYLDTFSAFPLQSLATTRLFLLFQVIFAVFYSSWCLVLRELLRVVTVLEESPASSSSFNSKTSLKNVKMELKLIQEVSSCLSVPGKDTETQTYVHKSDT